MPISKKPFLLLPPPFKDRMSDVEVADLIGYKVSTLRTRRSRGVTGNEAPMPAHFKVHGKVWYNGHEVYDYMLELGLLSNDERPSYTDGVIKSQGKELEKLLVAHISGDLNFEVLA